MDKPKYRKQAKAYLSTPEKNVLTGLSLILTKSESEIIKESLKMYYKAQPADIIEAARFKRVK